MDNKADIWIKTWDKIEFTENNFVLYGKKISIPKHVENNPAVKIKKANDKITVELNSDYLGNKDGLVVKDWSSEASHAASSIKYWVKFLLGKQINLLGKTNYSVSQEEVSALNYLKTLTQGRVLVQSHECLQCSWHTTYKPAAYSNRKNYVATISGKPLVYNQKIFTSTDRTLAKRELQRLGVKYIYLVKYEDYLEKMPFSPGDLGVEMSDSEVPVLQKNIINKCIQAAKPVIVATQMLDSMTRNPRPTRAEVSDVANAIIDKTDAVMLSGETAFGSYPVQVVKEMKKIIVATEKSRYAHVRFKYSTEHATEDFELQAAAIAQSVHELARKTGAKAIIGTTDAGFAPRFLSHQRPRLPILIATDKPKLYRQNCIYWGVVPLFMKSMSKLKDVNSLLKYFSAHIKTVKMLKKNEPVVLVAGSPVGQRMNLVEVVNLK
jgi:hypothetical protein